MNFLESHRILREFKGGEPLPFLLGMSGQAEKLDVFVRAAAATRRRSAVVRTLPFNTLSQYLLGSPAEKEREVFLLFPWDLVLEADWRSGLPTTPVDGAAVRARARQLLELIAKRPNARMLYCSAPLQPLFPNPADTSALQAWLSMLALECGARPIPPAAFSLASYLSNGSPFAGTELGDVAEAIITAAVDAPVIPAKVLVTDLDGVMWRGVVGEDGLEGIHYQPEGVGFRHFLYQTFLAKLKREGVLLAAVSRNDTELAHGPFKTERMVLRVDDFVVIVASYNAKSAQIREIARQLNLGLDSFVFVDDNPIEIAEVSAALPDTHVVQFPSSDDALPAFLDQLALLFARTAVTAEDAERTAMYQRRFAGMMPDTSDGAGLSDFLRGLDMSLVIQRRTPEDFTRAVQLINKTNQFNLNGRRVTEEDVRATIADGGLLYTAALTDRTGSHGEILACLIDRSQVVRSLVMSCRVFQRRAEHAFFVWLATRQDGPQRLDFLTTPRNEPVRQFLAEEGFGAIVDGMIDVNLDAFARAHEDDLKLFKVATPEES